MLEKKDVLILLGAFVVILLLTNICVYNLATAASYRKIAEFEKNIDTYIQDKVTEDLFNARVSFLKQNSPLLTRLNKAEKKIDYLDAKIDIVTSWND